MKLGKKNQLIEDSYLALVRRWPLRRIRNKSDYDLAAAMVEQLALRGEENLDAGETEYLEALSILIEAFDQQHYPIPADVRTPLQRLKDLMSEAGMNVSALGRVLGSQSAASMVLNGARELSKAQILKLADYFRIEPGFFLPSIN